MSHIPIFRQNISAQVTSHATYTAYLCPARFVCTFYLLLKCKKLALLADSLTAEGVAVHAINMVHCCRMTSGTQLFL